jgi:hypothetical protein
LTRKRRRRSHICCCTIFDPSCGNQAAKTGVASANAWSRDVVARRSCRAISRSSWARAARIVVKRSLHGGGKSGSRTKKRLFRTKCSGFSSSSSGSWMALK